MIPLSRRFGALRVVCLLGLFSVESLAADLSPLEQLGKKIFFDTNLSSPAGQSCASCHSPETGFTGPDSTVNLRKGVYPGATPNSYGNRKPPSVAYASFSPRRTWSDKDQTWVGGQFWDGRADDLVEQAKGPFLNPREMNNASAADVVEKVRHAEYRPLFERVYGPESLADGPADDAFDRIARAIAAYESSREVNAFSSRYDAFLAGRATLTEQELRGLKLFGGKANCSSCHPHQPGEDGAPPLFTNFAYENAGAPRNPANPFYLAAETVNPDGPRYRDLGLGAVLKDEAQNGKVKVPTLRNVARKPDPHFAKAYLHNGAFKSLKEVVRFYNRRDLTPEEFSPPDVEANVNHEDLGKLGLTDAEEDDVIAFLEALSDGYLESAPGATPPDVRISAAPDVPAAAAPGVPGPGPLPPIILQDRFRGARDIWRIERFRVGAWDQAGRDRSMRRR